MNKQADCLEKVHVLSGSIKQFILFGSEILLRLPQGNNYKEGKQHVHKTLSNIIYDHSKVENTSMSLNVTKKP